MKALSALVMLVALPASALSPDTPLIVYTSAGGFMPMPQEPLHIIIQRDGDVFELRGTRVVRSLGKVSQNRIHRVIATVDAMRVGPLKLDPEDEGLVCMDAPVETYAVRTTRGRQFEIYKMKDCQDFWMEGGQFADLVVDVMKGFRALVVLGD